MPFEGKELSPAAALDEKEYLARVAADLAACEPLPMKPTPAASANYVTDEQLGRVLEKVGRAIAAELKPLRQRIAELEQGQVHMAGTYKTGERYRQNGLVSFQGGLWLCLADTDTRPGSGSPAWRLAVKRGDAK